MPAIAAAAAIMGLTRCVRPRGPDGPQSCDCCRSAAFAGCKISGFIPDTSSIQIRAIQIRVHKNAIQPFLLGRGLMACDPGTTMARTFGLT